MHGTRKRPCDSYDRLEFFSWLKTSLNVPELVNWMRVLSFFFVKDTYFRQKILIAFQLFL